MTSGAENQTPHLSAKNWKRKSLVEALSLIRLEKDRLNQLWEWFRRSAKFASKQRLERCASKRRGDQNAKFIVMGIQFMHLEQESMIRSLPTCMWFKVCCWVVCCDWRSSRTWRVESWVESWETLRMPWKLIGTIIVTINCVDLLTAAINCTIIAAINTKQLIVQYLLIGFLKLIIAIIKCSLFLANN